MANVLMEQYLPAGATRDKYASMKQDKFYSDIQGQAKKANALVAPEDDGSTWKYAAKQAYNLHRQVEGTASLTPSKWKEQNMDYFK